MLEELISTMPLWQKLVAYAYLLIGLFIFAKTSQIRVMGRPIIHIGLRLALALFFPVILILGLVAGAIIFGLAIALLAIMGVYSMFTGKKIKRPRIPRIRINVMRKYD